MKYLFLLVVGVAGYLLGSFFAKRRKISTASSNLQHSNILENVGMSKRPDVQKKEERKQKILEFFEQKPEITNNDIEELLGVSDATATNYLDELQKEGKITQNGNTGRGVFYTING